MSDKQVVVGGSGSLTPAVLEHLVIRGEHLTRNNELVERIQQHEAELRDNMPPGELAKWERKLYALEAEQEKNEDAGLSALCPPTALAVLGPEGRQTVRRIRQDLAASGIADEYEPDFGKANALGRIYTMLALENTPQEIMIEVARAATRDGVTGLSRAHGALFLQMRDFAETNPLPLFLADEYTRQAMLMHRRWTEHGMEPLTADGSCRFFAGGQRVDTAKVHAFVQLELSACDIRDSRGRRLVMLSTRHVKEVTDAMARLRPRLPQVGSTSAALLAPQAPTVRDFANEKLVLAADGWIASEPLWLAWEAWRKERGVLAVSRAWFCRELRAWSGGTITRSKRGSGMVPGCAGAGWRV